MIIVIDTDDPAAQEWYDRIISDGEIEWPVPGGMGETGSFKFTTAKAWPGNPYVSVVPDAQA